ncbi:hypothetical protein RR42_m2853 [Cupriavidus basilensis]|uniref:Uncharacterized protein n=1 Tax=Cupriavidus basilensis TaxID=68895 RepID=A0A0C4Y4G6_9BURK|nr:hypothetical protein RR42_m2853 [Cupriavidus basilensis]
MLRGAPFQATKCPRGHAGRRSNYERPGTGALRGARRSRPQVGDADFAPKCDFTVFSRTSVLRNGPRR